MQALYRFIFCLMLAVSAVGGGSMAAEAGAMSEQSMAETMPDCDECGGGEFGEVTSCEQACASSLVASINGETETHEFPYFRHMKLPAVVLSAGLHSAPDPFPPKYLI